MELREALQILGPERVSRGMRAIDDRRTATNTIGCSCFIGEAFGGTSEQFIAVLGDRREYGIEVFTAAAVCEQYYEGWSTPRGITGQLQWATMPGDKAPDSRAELRAECLLLLAEHGTAVEPAVASCGIPVLVQGVTETL